MSPIPSVVPSIKIYKSLGTTYGNTRCIMRGIITIIITTLLLIIIISNNREVIKIPLGKGIVNCREICGPMTRLCSINKNIKKQ